MWVILVVVGVVMGYLVIGTGWTCLLQTMRYNPLPPNFDFDRFNPWENWQLGMLCLGWPVSVFVWTIFLSVGTIVTGLGWIVRQICPRSEI